MSDADLILTGGILLVAILFGIALYFSRRGK